MISFIHDRYKYIYSFRLIDRVLPYVDETDAKIRRFNRLNHISRNMLKFNLGYYVTRDFTIYTEFQQENLSCSGHLEYREGDKRINNTEMDLKYKCCEDGRYKKLDQYRIRTTVMSDFQCSCSATR